MVGFDQDDLESEETVMATTERIGWPEHSWFGGLHHWDYRDDMGRWRCSGCGQGRELPSGEGICREGLKILARGVN